MEGQLLTYTPSRDYRWYPAYVHCGQEIKTRDTLKRFGIEHFIPTEYRINSRRRKVEHPVINSIVFIHSARERILAFKMESGIGISYIPDRTRSGQQLTVPDRQMNDFIRVISESGNPPQVSVADIPPAGSLVCVTDGPLKGVEGTVLRTDGTHYVVVTILGTLSARAEVPAGWLKRIDVSDQPYDRK